MYKTASFFGAFTTITKIAVIKSLIPGEINVTGISATTDLSQPIVSQTLIHLRLTGLVTFRQQGACRYYKLVHPENIKILIEIAEKLTSEA